MRRRPRVCVVSVLVVAAFLVAPSIAGEPYEGASSAAAPEGAAVERWGSPVAPVRESGADDGPATRTVSVVADSAWSWYMDPRVLTTGSATLFSSVRSSGDVQVTSVDHGTARLRHAVIQPDFEADDHNAPSLTELEDGRIVAFWNAHGVVPAHYRVTVRPGDVTTFGPVQELTGSGLEDDPATYTSIIQLPGADERYHLFTRRASDDAWVVTTSDDLLTWSPAVRLFAHEDPESYPYVKFVGTGWATIHMVVSDTTASPGQESSLHHLVLSHGVFRRSDGTAIRSLAAVRGTRGHPPQPVDPAEGTRIYDGRGADGRARPYDIALAGREPVVAFTTGREYTSSWTYRWMRHRDGEWRGSTLTRSARDPAGLTLRHDDPRRVVLVRHGDVEEYRTADTGRTWTRRTIAEGRSGGNRTPATPWPGTDGRDSPVTAAWLNGGYTGFRDGAWSTTVTMETSDPAPLDLRVTWPATWSKGADISARVTAGVGGPPVRGRTAWLLVDRPDEERRWVRSARAGEDGVARLQVDRPLPAGTRVSVYVPASGAWGRAVSAPRVVPGADPTGPA